MSRPDVSASALLRMLGTIEGRRLARNQAALLVVNVLAAAAVAAFIRSVTWSPVPVIVVARA